MPSRDTEPSAPFSRDASRDDVPPEPRWDAPPSREADRRYDRGFEPARGRERDEPSAPAQDSFTAGTFTRPDAAGRSGLGSSSPGRQAHPPGRTGGQSYGGSGGRASGSQSQGYEPTEDAEGRGRQDSAQWSQSVYDRSEARPLGQPSGWERRPQEARREGPPAPRTAGWRQAGESLGAGGSGRPGPDRSDETQFDADYRQWREEQMRMLDREYAQWRQERYRKFAEEFSQWRSQRLQPKTPPVAPPERPKEPAASLGNTSALGPAPGDGMPGENRAREREDRGREDRSRDERGSGGGLLSSLLGGHGERHKP